MNRFHTQPEEGDLYKCIRIGEHTLELRYGYYTEADRALGEPTVIFPNLSEAGLFTQDGCRVVSAIQDICPYFAPSAFSISDECCVDCRYYSPPGDDIGICQCPANRRPCQERESVKNE